MYYERFEDLPVWNDAIGLGVSVLEWSQSGALSGVGDLKNQMERAVISISNNIAEGFERGTNEELLNFLYIAKGSAAEVRSMLHLVGRLWQANDGKSACRVQVLLGRVEAISRQLGRWIESIKDSPYTGKRHQDSRSRQTTRAAKRMDGFMDRVREARDAAVQSSITARGRGTAPTGSADSRPEAPAEDERQPIDSLNS